MKTSQILLPFLAVLAPSVGWASHPGCTCGTKTATPTSAESGVAIVAAEKAADAPARHPLKGVIVEVMSERSALLVRHEEIPGVMKAMTMLLKVDEAALTAVKKGDAVTGLLVRKADGWWLEEVKPIEPAN